MKKTLKVIGYLVLLVIVIVGAGAAYVEIDGIPSYPVRKIDLSVPVTPERVAEGKRWVGMLCANCHLNQETQTLSGRLMSDAPPEFGKIWVRNITQDKEHGIGTWTDGEIAYLLRTGIKRDGRYAPPWMAKMPHVSDDVIESIIAFLRSDDPWVKATPAPDFDTEPTFLSKFLCHVAFKPLPYPTTRIVAPPQSDAVAYGKYMVASLDCYTCHSADFKTMNVMEPERSGGYMGGGNQLVGADGHPAYSANITPDSETGIGRWSEADFVRAVRVGFRPDNTPVRSPMSIFKELHDDEAAAIYAYLRTVPPIKRANRDWGHEAVTGDLGKQLYHKYACNACHGENGNGLCDLRGAHKKYPGDDQLIAWIKDPQKILPGTKMPTWEGVIPESEFAPLAAYVRTLGQ